MEYKKEITIETISLLGQKSRTGRWQADIVWLSPQVSISEYPLSAACCISKITNALEAKLVII